MPTVTPILKSQLTESDITRLPTRAIRRDFQTNMNDEYENSSSSALKKTIFSLIVAAALIVGLRRWGKESFMKIADPENMKWYDHIKKAVNAAGEYIEKPFIAIYKMCGGKNAQESATNGRK